MTIKFLLQSEKERANVYVRMSISRGKVIKRKTGYVTSPSKFEKDRRLKLNLKELATKIERAYNLSIENEEEITGVWLEGIISGRIKKQTVQTQAREIILNAHSRPNSKRGVGLSEGRIKVYKTFINILNRFQKDVPIASVNLDFADRFKDWLFAQRYSVNYVGKNLELLKTVCRDANLKGAKISKELNQIRTLKERKKNIIVLTPADQLKIKQCVLTSERLDNVRKWLLLGCMIGQRGGDLLALTPDNIKEVKGVRVFEIVQQKTGKMVYIPIVPEADQYIKEFPYEISLQKFNDYLKELAEIAEVKKRLSSHVCRRSFATNYYGKIPTPILIGITGHSSESMFLGYIGKTSMDNALEFLNYF